MVWNPSVLTRLSNPRWSQQIYDIRLKSFRINKTLKQLAISAFAVLSLKSFRINKTLKLKYFVHAADLCLKSFRINKTLKQEVGTT